VSEKPTSALPKEDTKELHHFVSDAPFDLRSVQTLTPEQEKIYFAGICGRAMHDEPVGL
jgi:hypothetical protein